MAHAVAAVDGLDRSGAQRLPQSADAALHHLRCRRRGLLTPQGLGEGLGVHSLARTQGEGRDDDAVTGPEHLGRAVDLERSEHP